MGQVSCGHLLSFHLQLLWHHRQSEGLLTVQHHPQKSQHLMFQWRLKLLEIGASLSRCEVALVIKVLWKIWHLIWCFQNRFKRKKSPAGPKAKGPLVFTISGPTTPLPNKPTLASLKLLSATAPLSSFSFDNFFPSGGQGKKKNQTIDPISLLSGPSLIDSSMESSLITKTQSLNGHFQSIF